MRIVALFLIWGLISWSQIIFAQKEQNNMLTLLQRYKNADGGEVFELNYEISKMLVANDSIFFEQMSSNPEVFNKWMNDLEVGTFTCYIAEDEVEVLLYDAMLSKLKELMLQKTKKYLDKPEYQELAQKLKNKLMQITIRFVD